MDFSKFKSHLCLYMESKGINIDVVRDFKRIKQENNKLKKENCFLSGKIKMLEQFYELEDKIHKIEIKRAVSTLCQDCQKNLRFGQKSLVPKQAK
jgi:hypothetical protein